MGGSKPWPQVQIANADQTSAAVVIIGAGISGRRDERIVTYSIRRYSVRRLTTRNPPGICTAIDLKKNGIENFIILEKSTSVGGTWHDNKYPGCCCDGEALFSG